MDHQNPSQKATQSLRAKSVHYADSIENSITLSAEGDNHSIKTDETSIKGEDEDLNTDPEYSINTSILDTEEKDAKDLRIKLQQVEEQCKILQMEKETLNSNLEAEKTRIAKLEKKLQFVKDNQEVFMRLKEAYINMKYNEAAGRKMIEIREKGIQTWQGILCKACLETEEVRRQVSILTKKYSEIFVASPGEMEQLINTVKYLKDLIERREQSWALNMERENKLQYHIKMLERENATLRELLQKNHENLDETLIKEEEKIDEIINQGKKIEQTQMMIDTVTRDMEKMKRIIVKYEKRFREYERNPSKTIVHPLNDKEKKILNHIIARYNSKTTKTDKARSRSLSVEKTCLTRRPASPLKNSRSSTPTKPHRPESAAIMMIDNLLDGDLNSMV